jgi:hypothetical protein
MDWIHLARDRDKSQAFVDLVTELWVTWNAAISLLPEELLGFRKGLCCMDLIFILISWHSLNRKLQ